MKGEFSKTFVSYFSVFAAARTTKEATTRVVATITTVPVTKTAATTAKTIETTATKTKQ